MVDLVQQPGKRRLLGRGRDANEPPPDSRTVLEQVIEEDEDDDGPEEVGRHVADQGERPFGHGLQGVAEGVFHGGQQ
jgi:hypothetical protein